MAWTAPRSFVAGELETAAIFNTHLRDNLKYLHGDSGPITLNDNLGIGAAPSDRLLLSTATGDTVLRLETLSTAATAAYMKYVRSATGAARQWWIGTGINADDSFSVYDQTAAAFRLHITAAGNVGIGTIAPQGKLHTYGTISGMLKFEADAVAGSLIPVIPDGAGDVQYGIMGLYAVRSSGGTTRGGTFTGAATTLLAPSNNVDLYNVGGTDILQLQVAANGSVGVIRTAGSLTYKVSLVLNWLAS